MRNSFLTILPLFMISILCTAQNRTSTDSAVIVKKNFIVDDTLLLELNAALSDYYSISAAIASENKEQVKGAVANFLISFNKIELKRMSIYQHKKYMILEEDLGKEARKIGKAVDWKQTREHFNILSGELWKVLKLFNVHPDGVTYRNLCPLENGQWISSQKYNPDPYHRKNQTNCSLPTDSIY